MKTNFIANNTIINSIMRKYIKYLCAVVMVLGVSVNAWGADPSAPSANYTLIKSVSSLSTNDRVILYCPTTETAVSGLSTCNSSTEARMSSSSQEWVEYKVTVVDASTIKLQDTRIGSNNYVYNNSGKFQYAGSSSATALSITAAGIINAGGTNFQAKSVGTGDCARASARFASGGSNVYVFKVIAPKESKYYVTSSSAELSITIDDNNGDDYGTYYSSSALVTVYTTAAFSGRINAELSGFTHCNFTDNYIVAVNDDNDANNFIINTANSNEGIYVRSWSLGWDNLQTGVYSGYIHVYPATGTNTTDEFYIPLTVTITNGSGSDVCDACDANPTIGAASINGGSAFILTSLTDAIPVSSGTCSPGSNCSWVDYGFAWQEKDNATTNKVQVGTSGTATSWATGAGHQVQPSGSTTPTAWAVGKTYGVATYGKNAKDGATFQYGTTATFILRSITFNSNGGSSVGPWYVKSGGTYSAPSTPTKTGYDFGGWYTDDGSFENAVNWSSAVSENKTYYAKWTAKDISLTLNKNNSDVSGSSNGSASVKYDATSLTSISHATRTGYSIEGYYAEAGCTNKVLTSAGALVNYTGYVVSNKWARTTTPTTLYAKWTVNSHTLAVSSVSNVTIESTTPDVDAGGSTFVDYGTTVTLAYSGVTSGYYWGGWNVYKTDDASTKVTVTSNQFTMPDYDVTVSAVVYPRANLVTRCPSVEFEVTGDNAWLTSYAGVEVYTDIATNQITIQCDDWGSANRIYVSYLDGEGTTITKTSSLFRLCNASTFNYMDASNDYFDVSGTDHEDGVKYAISYKPGASEYDQIDTWTLRLTAANGTTPLDYQDITIHGRALPEKFVIAAKIDGVWKALPADIRTSSGTMDKAPYPISVNDADAPTTAYYAPKAALYSGAARPTGAVNKNRGGIRLHTETEDGSDGYLQGGRSNSSASLWRTSYGCTTGMQSWYLRSTTFGDYKINVDPTIYVSSGSGEGDDGEGSTSTLLDRKLCVDAGKIGWYKTSADDFRILKVTNEVDLREATVYEWGEHGVVLNADMTDVASVTAHIENGTPSAATVTAVNAASLTAGKYVKVDAGALTIGAIANEKKVLNLHWKNSGGTEIGVSSIVIPRVIASSGTMSTLDATKGNWNTEVHVLPGQTLTADGGSFASSTVVVKQLIVYPGATVNVSTGTLTATTLRLRNGWTRAGSTQYNTARVYIADDAALTKTTASMDYDIYNSAEGRHYYPLAVPFETAVSGIDYADSYLAGFSTYGASGQYLIKEYNGARRATNGEDQANNWTAVSSSANLSPGKGYIMTAVPVKGEAIIRVPLVYNNAWTADGEKGTANYDDADHTKNVIAVTAHTGSAATAHTRHKGWNMLGVPFMACYGAGSDMYGGVGDAALINGELVVNTSASENMEYQSTTIPYVSVPSHDFAEYVQTDITETKLLPGWSFFVQVNTSGNLTFKVSNQRPNDDNPIYAPKRTMDDEVVRTGIILSDGEASDKTTILISDQYSGSEYEVGADLEKMFGSGYTLATYSLSGETRLAYNAMSKTDAQQVIPIGYRAPADGEYTFSLNPRYADAPFERVDLIDYLTGELTNLMTSSYTFSTERTQNDSRFALNVVLEKKTATDIDDVTGDNRQSNGVEKVIINDKLYIIRGGQIYDATGKRVKEINK